MKIGSLLPPGSETRWCWQCFSFWGLWWRRPVHCQQHQAQILYSGGQYWFSLRNSLWHMHCWLMSPYWMGLQFGLKKKKTVARSTQRQVCILIVFLHISLEMWKSATGYCKLCSLKLPCHFRTNAVLTHHDYMCGRGWKTYTKQILTKNSFFLPNSVHNWALSTFEPAFK